MSDETKSVKTDWTSVQVYTMSVLCLFFGVTVGYLFRGSTTPSVSGASVPATAAVAQPQMPTGNPMATTQGGGMPASGIPANGAQPAPEQLKQMADKQVAKLLEQLNKNPKDADTLMKVGGYYFAARQYDDSAKYFERAAIVRPSANAFTELGNAQYYGGATDKALESWNKALQIDPRFADALFNLGMWRWKVQGDVKGAIQSWEKLVKTNPNHPKIEQVKQMIAKAKEHEHMPAITKTDKPAM